MVRKIINKAKKVFRRAIYANIYKLDSNATLNDKVVFITGGGSGIGYAVAENAVKAGATVIICGRSEEKLKSACEKIGGGVKYIIFNVNDFDKINIFEEIESKFGIKVNCFVNNAGVYSNKKYLTWDSNDFDTLFNTNLKSSYFLTNQFVKYCNEKNIRSNIVVTSSNRSLFGDTSPYGLSKIALNSFIEGTAKVNINKNIRINGVAPGMTATEINGISNDSDLYSEWLPHKRVTLAVEIANVICFLLSDLSNCINGAIIPCDFGETL